MGPLERSVAASLRAPLLVVVSLAVLVVAGLVAWSRLPVEAFPDLTNQQVVVVTEAPGVAADDVEQRITYPIESALMGVAGAEQVRSLSKFGLSLVTVIFGDSVPLYFARQQVAERLAEVRGRLPSGADPRLGPVATAFGEIFQYLVEGEALSPLERKTLHDWEIRLRLRSVPGVSEVNAWGGETQQYEVVVDPRRLEKYGLTLPEVMAAVGENNLSFGGGFLEHRSERFTVRGLGLATSLDDLRRIVLTAEEGTPVFVGDVAEVRIAGMPRQGAVTRDGRGETVSGMVILRKGENAAEVTARVKQRVADLEKRLPSGITIDPFYDQSEVVDRTSRTLRRNLLEGSALVVAVLLLFLRDLRAALLVAMVIPLSLLSGFLGMTLFGVSANLMSLGAIDFGLLVDGAVVMIENLARRRREASGESPLEVFSQGATEVARPVAFGVLIILAVYLPILTLEGLEGKMFRPMAITVCSAIFGALVLALFVVPSLAARWLPARKAHAAEPKWLVRLREAYLRLLRIVLAHPRRTLAIAAVPVLAAFASLPFLGTEFMPRLDEGSILIETRKLPSVSLPESVDSSTRIEQVLQTFPEVRRVVTKLGRPDIATEAMGIYQGDVYVLLHPHETWTTGRSKEDLVDAMAAALSQFPGIRANFTQPMAMRLDEVISGVKADVAVKVFGPRAETLQQIAARIETILSGVRGVADLQVEVMAGGAQLEIRIDREKLARYGLNVADVRTVVDSATGGVPATEFLEGVRRFAVVVRLPEAWRHDAESVSRLPLLAPGGERILLSQVAEVVSLMAPEAIQREDGERRLVVQANVRGRDIGSFVAEASERLDSELELPGGYHLDWGGQFENQQRAMQRLTVVVPLSIAIILLLLYATFRQARQAWMILLNLPFAMVGGVATLWLRGINLNLSASIGFIALFGVAVLNGIVLISAVNARREEGESIHDALLGGAAQRLQPVLMTALVASVGFLPMALSHGAGAEVQRPLASVVIGGLLTSTLLTLLVLPTVYERVEGWAARRKPA